MSETKQVAKRGWTRVPGLSAAGDLSALMQPVANAVAAGSSAAAMIVHD